MSVHIILGTALVVASAILLALVLRHFLPLILGADARLAALRSRRSALCKFACPRGVLDFHLLTGTSASARLALRLDLGQKRLDLSLALGCVHLSASRGSLACSPRFLLELRVVIGLQLAREPVNGPPQAGAEEGKDDEVDAVCGQQKSGEDELQRSEGNVGGDEE